MRAVVTPPNAPGAEGGNTSNMETTTALAHADPVQTFNVAKVKEWLAAQQDGDAFLTSVNNTTPAMKPDATQVHQAPRRW
jgi:hypothetical protein